MVTMSVLRVEKTPLFSSIDSSFKEYVPAAMPVVSMVTSVAVGSLTSETEEVVSSESEAKRRLMARTLPMVSAA